ncbi:hypothetical protein [Streptomyces gilvus]|uniref:hypothetical protein n=1 Tax=Streptomyces gilvus TaxID=2920937 RepID=UPI001F103A85|nr:hypothetical protein [Streptomyces sp. CME 23]MCH5673545.1 hypothetical protein [Streptomyces sp. CME 23]
MKRLARAFLETAMVHGLLGWLYVAAVAALRPDDLTAPVSTLLHVRRDTFGAVCFAVSALAAFVLQAVYGTWWSRPAPARGAVLALLRTTATYALLAWAYLCVNSLTHPYTMARPLTHFADVPREGETASWAFAASAVALLLARTKAPPPARRRDLDGDPGGVAA